MSTEFFQARGVSKSYGGVPAIVDMRLTMQAGEVHALMGENGAGKSTFIKCLAGAVRPDSGTITVNGSRVAPGDIRAAEAAGIIALHQESTAFPHLQAADNIFVGREMRRAFGLLDKVRMRRETEALLARLGERLDLDCPLEDMTLAQRQMVGMARALSRKSRLLIMDEPTASLSARETQALFRIIRQLQSEGISILYISHRLEEVFELSSRVTVMRDGRPVGTHPLRDVSRNELVQMMVGRELLTLEQKTATVTTGKPILEVLGLTQAGKFQNISLCLRAGEVVGLAGLVGAGRSEVANAIFGMTRADSGTVVVDGKSLPLGAVTEAIKRGIALVPEDRQHQGLVLPLSVASNLLLPALGQAGMGTRSRRREEAVVMQLIEKLAVKTAGSDVAASTLSGGNQQKLVVGKWLVTPPRALLLDEPTRGVDVGAKAEIYSLIRALAQDGMATLVISSDLPELLALCDRILVLRAGQIAGEVSRQEATEEKILFLALPCEGAQEAAA